VCLSLSRSLSLSLLFMLWCAVTRDRIRDAHGQVSPAPQPLAARPAKDTVKLLVNKPEDPSIGD